MLERVEGLSTPTKEQVMEWNLRAKYRQYAVDRGITDPYQLGSLMDVVGDLSHGLSDVHIGIGLASQDVMDRDDNSRALQKSFEWMERYGTPRFSLNPFQENRLKQGVEVLRNFFESKIDQYPSQERETLAQVVSTLFGKFEEGPQGI